MNLETLKQAFRNAGIHPVQVEGNGFPSEKHGETAVGTLEDFIEAVKALRVPIVLICAEVLIEAEFHYEPEADPGDVVTLDLCREYPQLERFKKHVGTIGRFRLFVPMPPTNLNYYIQEGWHLEFESCWFAAVEKVDRAPRGSRAKIRPPAH